MLPHPRSQQHKCDSRFSKLRRDARAAATTKAQCAQSPHGGTKQPRQFRAKPSCRRQCSASVSADEPTSISATPRRAGAQVPPRADFSFSASFGLRLAMAAQAGFKVPRQGTYAAKGRCKVTYFLLHTLCFFASLLRACLGAYAHTPFFAFPWLPSACRTQLAVALPLRRRAMPLPLRETRKPRQC